MSDPTLHSLLWGPLTGPDIREWTPQPWAVPAVGLPTHVAVVLYQEAQKSELPDDWSSSQGPLVWELAGCEKVLSEGRRIQLGLAETYDVSSQPVPVVKRTVNWNVAPHSAYFMPFLDVAYDVVDATEYAAYCDILLLLTALDGGESILNLIEKHGPGGLPYEDRWDFRSRIHLSMSDWQLIDGTIRWARSLVVPDKARASLLGRGPFAPHETELELAHFVSERVDLRLDTKLDIEAIAGVSERDLPPELCIEDGQLGECLTVRIGQVDAWPKDVLARFPRVSISDRNFIMQQVADVVRSRNISENDHVDLVVFPEVSIPNEEIRTLRDLATDTGRAILAGLYWRALAPVHGQGATSSRRWFVNEAELVVPLGHGDRGPTTSRWYRVRKPTPAHVEQGLARAVTTRGAHTTWHVLKGRRWYRFVHPKWGDFSIAICADLIDAEPWRLLRGEVLHIFTVAFNKDVDLYDSLTWVRAYETFCNVVAVNHGRFGGSFLWTPARSYLRELARSRGNRLMLAADVDLPVAELLKWQLEGADDAVASESATWLGQPGQGTSVFKSPPPGYVRRSVR